jgi:hypothetical protein
VWIIIAAGVAAVVMAAVARRRAASDSDLGWVTERWLTEYRADQAADSK